MSVQEVPVCFKCDTKIEGDPVYEAPCGHPGHSSAVFHPICLMEFREKRHEYFAHYHRKLMRIAAEIAERGVSMEGEDE